MGKQSPAVLVVAVALTFFVAVGAARLAIAQPPAEDAYCCLCADCAGAGCVLVDAMTGGFASAAHTCPTLCPDGCHGSLLLEGTCTEHSVAECPVTTRAPALSPWAMMLCLAALGTYGVRRARRP